MPHDRMLATRNTYTWINKYIFPGGFLPSVQVDRRDHPRAHRLRLVDRLSMGRTTPRPCGCGTRRSCAASERVLSLGFDETFLRMWHFYLEYSRAGFASGYIDVNQLTLREDQPVTAPARTAQPTASPPARGGAPPVPRRRPAGAAAAWDGSVAGPVDAPLVVLSSVDAVRRLLWHPGELGAAQAYVTGEIDVPGDLDHGADPRVRRGERARPGGRRPRRPALLARRPHRRRASARSAARPPRPRRRRGSAAGCTARCATGARSASTTTSPTSSTS